MPNVLGGRRTRNQIESDSRRPVIRDLTRWSGAIAAFAVVALFLFGLVQLLSSTLVAFWTMLIVAFHP